MRNCVMHCHSRKYAQRVLALLSAEHNCFCPCRSATSKILQTVHLFAGLFCTGTHTQATEHELQNREHNAARRLDSDRMTPAASALPCPMCPRFIVACVASLLLAGCGLSNTSNSNRISADDETQHKVLLTWNPSSSTIKGYNVYRGVHPGGPYSRIADLVPGNAYNDKWVSSARSTTTWSRPLP
jgi:hypothetical protein